MKTRLNKRLYSKTGIQEAVDAYKAVCAIDMRVENEYFELDFKNADPTLGDVLVDEFNNFALFSTITGKKTW